MFSPNIPELVGTNFMWCNGSGPAVGKTNNNCIVRNRPRITAYFVKPLLRVYAGRLNAVLKAEEDAFSGAFWRDSIRRISAYE